VAEISRLASLLEVQETETAFGGRQRVWTQIATLWVDFEAGSSRLQSAAGDAGTRPVALRSASAVARDLDLAAPGQRLSLDAVLWDVTAVDRARPAPGFMTLSLERADP
jgi:hypothetical protein